MKYRSETRFEIFYSKFDGTNKSEQYKVHANGCNSIVFMALPMTSTVDNNRFNFSEDIGISSLRLYVPRINGIPLFPTILNNVFEPGQPYAAPGETINDALTRLQPGDKLEFTNAPEVVDETIYQVHHLGAPELGFMVPLMVIRRFLFPI